MDFLMSVRKCRQHRFIRIHSTERSVPLGWQERQADVVGGPRIRSTYYGTVPLRNSVRLEIIIRNAV